MGRMFIGSKMGCLWSVFGQICAARGMWTYSRMHSPKQSFEFQPEAEQHNPKSTERFPDWASHDLYMVWHRAKLGMMFAKETFFYTLQHSWDLWRLRVIALCLAFLLQAGCWLPAFSEGKESKASSISVMASPAVQCHCCKRNREGCCSMHRPSDFSRPHLLQFPRNDIHRIHQSQPQTQQTSVCFKSGVAIAWLLLSSHLPIYVCLHH